MADIHTSIDLNALDSPGQLKQHQRDPQNEDVLSQLAPSSMHVVGFVLSDRAPTGPLRTFKLNSYELLDGKTRSKSNLNVAILVTYITGLFFFFPHIASIALSLRSIKTGQMQTHRSKIIVFSFLELTAWVTAAALAWGYTDRNDDPYTADILYWGWITIVTWGVTALAFGIPRVIYSRHMLSYETSYSEDTNNERHLRGLKIASLITYIVGVATFFPHLASIILSLVMFKKGYITKNKNSVLAFCVLEFAGLVSAAALCWLNLPSCYDSFYFTSYGNSRYPTCGSMWVGWIFIGVWAVFALAFGIPRVIFVWNQNLVKELKDLKVSPYGVAMA